MAKWAEWVPIIKCVLTSDLLDRHSNSEHPVEFLQRPAFPERVLLFRFRDPNLFLLGVGNPYPIRELCSVKDVTLKSERFANQEKIVSTHMSYIRQK